MIRAVIAYCSCGGALAISTFADEDELRSSLHDMKFYKGKCHDLVIRNFKDGEQLPTWCSAECQQRKGA